MRRQHRLIFVNTSGWLALYNPNDPNHAAARALWDDLRNQPVRFVTTDYVLDQVFTAMKMFGSLDAAQAIYTVVNNTSLLRFFMTDSVIFERAWKVFVDDEHPQFTFTDCINYAVIQYLGADEVFTFDPSFTAPGLIRIPSSGARG
ncbi:MAG: PIN domain-containing protein [Chloroflexota bacterium]|nr:PIN domain-containing protein [Chloroflexota bacterium]MDQ5864407.1 PIN domain-containing protein [Chloroflexota bacterium]